MKPVASAINTSTLPGIATSSHGAGTFSGVVEISVASPICCVSYPGMLFLSFPSITAIARYSRSGRTVSLQALSPLIANAGSPASGRCGEEVLGRSPHLPATDIQYAMRERAEKTVMARQLTGRRRVFDRISGRIFDRTFGRHRRIAAGTSHSRTWGTCQHAAGFGNSHSFEHIQYYCPDWGAVPILNISTFMAGFRGRSNKCPDDCGSRPPAHPLY